MVDKKHLNREKTSVIVNKVGKTDFLDFKRNVSTLFPKDIKRSN